MSDSKITLTISDVRRFCALKPTKRRDIAKRLGLDIREDRAESDLECIKRWLLEAASFGRLDDLRFILDAVVSQPRGRIVGIGPRFDGQNDPTPQRPRRHKMTLAHLSHIPYNRNHVMRHIT